MLEHMFAMVIHVRLVLVMQCNPHILADTQRFGPFHFSRNPGRPTRIETNETHTKCRIQVRNEQQPIKRIKALPVIRISPRFNMRCHEKSSIL